MPGADLPPNINPSDPTPPTDSRPMESNPTSQTDWNNSDDEQWETVNLPNAMSVDRLPVAEEASEEGTNPEAEQQTPISRQFNPGEAHPENLSELIRALHECNRDLINRVTELEAELDECRKALQDKESEVYQRSHELAFAQEQVSRLFGKLELSNQVIRRQQVLVETLTEQWETSQTRMAHMERECALAQQRYNEQFHELVQTQNVSRELRSRLHRQQRHTLQFKAALERCLEMQSRQPNLEWREEPKTVPNLPKLNREGEESDAPPPEQPPYPLSVSRSQPVQPWSADSDGGSDSVGRLDEILRQEQNPDDFHGEPVDEWLEWDRAMSADAAEALSQLEDFPEEEGGFGESGVSDLVDLEELENYWYANEPDPEPFASNPFDEISEPESVAADPEPIQHSPRFVEDELDRIRIEYASSTMPSFDLDRGRFSPPIASGNAPADPPEPDLNRHPHRVSSASPPSNWPAPLIQPTRQKKRRSLASIELPRFPQSSPAEAVMVFAGEPEPF